MKKMKLSLSLVLVLVTIQLSQAQMNRKAERPSPQAVFEKMDTNEDGKISMAEFELPPRAVEHGMDKQEVFNRIDKNEDGFLTSDEMKRGKPNRGERPSPKAVFEKMDTNEDGKISMAEFELPPRAVEHGMDKQEVFNRIDKNEDGFLTSDEMKRGKPRGDNKERRKKGKMMEKIKAADVNGDKKLSFEEFSTIDHRGQNFDAEKVFNRLDADASGFIEMSELKQAHNKRMKGISRNKR